MITKKTLIDWLSDDFKLTRGSGKRDSRVSAEAREKKKPACAD